MNNPERHPSWDNQGPVGNEVSSHLFLDWCEIRSHSSPEESSEGINVRAKFAGNGDSSLGHPAGRANGEHLRAWTCWQARGEALSRVVL